MRMKLLIGNADRNATPLNTQTKNFYHFVRGGNDGLSGMRRETMFINLLESTHPEAEILVLVKDGIWVSPTRLLRRSLLKRIQILSEVVVLTYLLYKYMRVCYTLFRFISISLFMYENL